VTSTTVVFFKKSSVSSLFSRPLLFPVDGVKCILGCRLARVRTSLLWCILRKVRIKSHTGILTVLCEKRTLNWNMYPGCDWWRFTSPREHEYREVQTRTHIEKRRTSPHLRVDSARYDPVCLLTRLKILACPFLDLLPCLTDHPVLTLHESPSKDPPPAVLFTSRAFGFQYL